MVDVCSYRRRTIAAEPRMPDQIQPGGQQLLSQRATLLLQSGSKLDDLYVVPRSQSGYEPADVSRDSALRLAEVGRVYCRGKDLAAVTAAPAQRKNT